MATAASTLKVKKLSAKLQQTVKRVTAKRRPHPKKQELSLKDREARFPAPEMSAFRAKNTTPLSGVIARSDTNLWKLKEKKRPVPHTSETDQYYALDCEFVGTGDKGRVSELARVSIVGYYGNIVYDQYVQPEDEVTDYRTPYSGIRPRDLERAIPFVDAKARVTDILTDGVLIGHNISSDLKALKLTLPAEQTWAQTLDTQRLTRFKRNQFIKGNPGLRALLFNYMGLRIQRGPHCSVEDARSTMLLFRAFKQEYIAEAQAQRGKKTINVNN